MGTISWTNTNVNNCTVTVFQNGDILANGDTLMIGANLRIVIRTLTGYIFESTPLLRKSVLGSSTSQSFINDRGNTGMWTIETITTDGEYTIRNAVAVVGEPYFYIDIDELTNATSNLDINTRFNLGDTFELITTANNGYYFSTYPHYTFKVGGVYQNVNLTAVDGGEYPKIFSCEITFDSVSKSNYSITATATAQPITDMYGIVTLYNPTTQQLKELSTIRYVSGELETVDLGNYITNCLRLFVNIPQYLDSTIILGGYNTSILSNTIGDNVVITQCGETNVNTYFNNNLDFENTSIRIYLPFIGFQDLDVSKIMDRHLRLVYKTNVINGDSVAMLYTSIFKQLVINGNFTNNRTWYTTNCTLTANNNIGRITSTVNTNCNISQALERKINHKYLFAFTAKNSNNTMVTSISNAFGGATVRGQQTTEKQIISSIFTSVRNVTALYPCISLINVNVGDYTEIENVIYVDLTEACGEGNEPETYEEFIEIYENLTYCFQCNVGYDIPYKLNGELDYKGNTGVNSNYLLGFKPFLEIERNKTINNNIVIGNDNSYTTINNLSGFIKCSEVFNNIDAPIKERDEIDTLLKQGIII